VSTLQRSSLGGDPKGTNGLDGRIERPAKPTSGSKADDRAHLFRHDLSLENKKAAPRCGFL
jgi:hypothetical protein